MRRRLVPLLAFGLVLVAAVPAAGFSRVPHNPADAMAARPMDPERYDHARHCVKHPSRGALALQSWLEGHVRGVSWGILRCEKLSKRDYSLHAEGRALDWHLDVHSPADRQAADKLIRLLLAPDRTGNLHALARRMGIQEIIWNCHSWWSGGEGMEPYSVCYDRKGRRKKRVDETLAHRNHVHLGLSLPGARLQTSFWRR
jgi:hypothetical protein